MGADLCLDCLARWIIPEFTAAGRQYACPCGNTWTTTPTPSVKEIQAMPTETQPKTLTQAELFAEAQARFGNDPRKFAFVCPNCGDVATIQDFLDAGNPDAAGQECIGRILGVLKKDREYTGRGCDWVAYGLFCGPWTIVMPAGDGKPERNASSFALAEGASS